MDRLFLASRYLLHHRIMWVSTAGVALGLAAIIFVDSIFNGFVKEHLRVLKGVQADVVVRTATRRGADPEAIDRLAQRLRGVKGVAGVSRRVYRPCLFPTDRKLPKVLAFGQMSRGPVLQVLGIHPEEEVAVSELRQYLSRVPAESLGPGDGQIRRCRVPDVEHPFDTSDLKVGGAFAQDLVRPVLLGERLAEHLGLQRGDVIQLVTFPDGDSADDEETVTAKFRLAGTFETGRFDLDLSTAFVHFDDLCEFAGMSPHPHELALRAADGVDAEELTLRVRESIGGDDRAVSSWVDRSEYIRGAIQNQREILDVILFVLVFVASFTLLITLCMTVTEKRRDLGILASMGSSRVGVATIFTSCGLLVGVVGSILGVGLGLWVTSEVNAVHDLLSGLLGAPVFTKEVYGFSEVPASVDLPLVAKFVVASWGMTLVFSLVPAWIAGSLAPVDALRRN